MTRTDLLLGSIVSGIIGQVALGPIGGVSCAAGFWLACWLAKRRKA